MHSITPARCTQASLTTAHLIFANHTGARLAQGAKSRLHRGFILHGAGHTQDAPSVGPAPHSLCDLHGIVIRHGADVSGVFTGKAAPYVAADGSKEMRVRVSVCI